MDQVLNSQTFPLHRGVLRKERLHVVLMDCVNRHRLSGFEIKLPSISMVPVTEFDIEAIQDPDLQIVFIADEISANLSVLTLSLLGAGFMPYICFPDAKMMCIGLDRLLRAGAVAITDTNYFEELSYE